jgi:hypothetical protein
MQCRASMMQRPIKINNNNKKKKKEMPRSM